MEHKKLRKFFGEIKRILPLLVVIIAALFFFSDAVQLEVQLYQLSMMAFVLIVVHILRQWLFPYFSMMHIYYIARKDSMACAIMFASMVIFISVLIVMATIK